MELYFAINCLRAIFETYKSEMFNKLRQQLECEITVSAELMLQLEARGVILRFHKNEYVLQAGEVCDFSCFIQYGCFIHLHINADGKESIIGFAVDEAYSFFSSPESYFTRQPSVCGIRALEDSMVIRYSRTDLDELCITFPEFSTFYYKIIADGFLTLYKFNTLRLTLTSTEFLKYLLTKQPIYLQRIPDKYIALFMGISKEWLCKLKTKILRS
ncbi:Crp/Fnr family transcriptional regulator [Williamwhitmania taraxaci]|nr:Crp/Fnr family transcriptional regulator [Williamwhitmania taraxaci]